MDGLKVFGLNNIALDSFILIRMYEFNYSKTGIIACPAPNTLR